MIRRRRQGVALMLAALLVVTVTAVAHPAGAIEEAGSVGGTTGSDALTQVVQAVTQLAQQVSQIAQMVGAILTQGAGRLFGGPGGTPPIIGSGWGIPQLPTSAWLNQLAQWVTAILGQAQSAVWSEWGSEWGQAPDYAYSATQIAAELKRIAAALPADIARWVEALAARLVQAPAPTPGTPQASSTAAANTGLMVAAAVELACGVPGTGAGACASRAASAPTHWAMLAGRAAAIRASSAAICVVL